MIEITTEIAKSLSKLPNTANHSIHASIIDDKTQFVIHYGNNKVYLTHISEYEHTGKNTYKLKERKSFYD